MDDPLNKIVATLSQQFTTTAPKAILYYLLKKTETPSRILKK